MSGKKISIFLLLFGFVLGLMAFQSSTDNLCSLFADSIQFVVPANFPKPLYAPKDNQLSSDGFLLGKALFYDANLSSDKTVSCGNCHQASAAFANVGIALSTGVKNCAGTRNAPALFNLAWQKDFMILLLLRKYKLWVSQFGHFQNLGFLKSEFCVSVPV